MGVRGGMVYVNDILAEEQRYVIDRAVSLGYELIPRVHGEETRTCAEKLAILGEEFALTDMVKVLFGRVRANGDSGVYALVTPEFGYGFDRATAQAALAGIGITVGRKKVSVEVRPAFLPEGMRLGTATPFVSEDQLEGYGGMYTPVAGIFIHSYLGSCSRVVDISVGGTSEEALRRSLQLPGKAIPEILLAEFGDTEKIHIVDLPQ